MLACIAAALAIPASVTESLRGPVSLLFLPLSRPTKGVSDLVSRHVFSSDALAAQDEAVPKSQADLLAENTALRTQIVSLITQLDDLKRLNADRSNMGEVRDRAVTVRVTGLDASLGSARQFLQLSVPMSAGIRERMVAVYPQGLVGRVAASALGGARVQLTTDRDFRVQAMFVRFTRLPNGSLQYRWLPTPSAPLVVGDGGGMKVQNLSAKEVEASGIQAGDWLAIRDSEFPALLQGYRIGQVTAIRNASPLWADIRVMPPSDLRLLQEVQIVNRP